MFNVILIKSQDAYWRRYVLRPSLPEVKKIIFPDFTALESFETLRLRIREGTLIIMMIKINTD
jgi:hypothetical protein